MVDRPGGSVVAYCVDHERCGGAVPGFDEARGLAVELDHLDPGREERPRGIHDRETGAVVAAERVADPDDDDARRCLVAGHERSTTRSRKWVAQEMHGS